MNEVVEREVEVRDRKEEGRRTPRGERGLRLTEREVAAIEFLLDQKCASREQVYRAIWKDQVSKSSKYAWDRLNLLERHGLIRSIRVHTRAALYYLVTAKGVRALELLQPDALISPPIRTVHYQEFEHDDRVTECRLLLEEKAFVSAWKSERRLLAELLQEAEGNRRESLKFIAKGRLPDAIFQFQDGTTRAFELELTPKSKARYRAKVVEYIQKIESKQVDFVGVLFVPCSRRIFEALSDVTRDVSTLFKVIPYEQLREIQ